jgi:hypothetical protein
MTDITPALNDLLKSHNAPPTTLSVRQLDEFLKEAYRIVLRCLPYSSTITYKLIRIRT